MTAIDRPSDTQQFSRHGWFIPKGPYVRKVDSSIDDAGQMPRVGIRMALGTSVGRICKRATQERDGRHLVYRTDSACSAPSICTDRSCHEAITCPCAVDDFSRNVAFYSATFAAEPARLEMDDANWLLDDPPEGRHFDAWCCV